MSNISHQTINSQEAPKPIGPFSHAVLAGQTLYISGCVGADPKSGQLVEGGVVAETHQALKNIGNILNEAGCTYNNVVKCTVLLADINDFPIVNKIYAQYFTSNYPARSTYQVAALPRSSRVEIEAIAIKNLKPDIKSSL